MDGGILANRTPCCEFISTCTLCLFDIDRELLFRLNCKAKVRMASSASDYRSFVKVRAATVDDLDAIEVIVQQVVKAMNDSGNFQWDQVYPLRADFAKDVANGELWVASNMNGEGHILGFAAITEEQSIEYKEVGWDITIPALVMHRAAVATYAQGKGVCGLLFKKQDELSVKRGYNLVRVDTNSDNKAMQAAIIKAGYEYSGNCRLLSKPETMKFMCFQKTLPAEGTTTDDSS